MAARCRVRPSQMECLPRWGKVRHYEIISWPGSWPASQAASWAPLYKQKLDQFKWYHYQVSPGWQAILQHLITPTSRIGNNVTTLWILLLEINILFWSPLIGLWLIFSSSYCSFLISYNLHLICGFNQNKAIRTFYLHLLPKLSTQKCKNRLALVFTRPGHQ